MSARRRRPSLVLPSGRLAVLEPIGGEPLESDVVDGVALLGGRALVALRTGRLRVEVAGALLDAAAIDALPLGDYHVLRDAAARLDVVAHDADTFTCSNCDAALEVDVADEVPIEHFAKRFAKDAERRREDGTDLPCTLHLPEPLRLGRRRSSALTLGPVSVTAAIPLWAAVEREGGLAATPAVVRALGIRAAGDVRDARAIGAALDSASDRVWDALSYAFDVLHYPAELVVPYTCPTCGARNDLDTPQPRELPFDEELPEVFAADAKVRAEERAQRRERQQAADAFPDAAAFERLVERLAPEVYRAKGVRNIAIRVEDGPAAVDDGGEPLLGSYEPIETTDDSGLASWEFLITVYYETFRRMHREDGPYDLEAELRETLEHEVDHHLAHLRGDDPVDQEEHAEIDRELVATFGKERVVGRAVAGELRTWAGFLKLAWPLLVAFALLVLWLVWTGRI